MDLAPYQEFIMRALAREYSLGADEEDALWKPSWKLYSRLVMDGKDQQKEIHKRSNDAVKEAFSSLKEIARGADKGQARLHLTRVADRPLANRSYVIFSDHHITFQGHRHSPFSTNAALYAGALKHYYNDGFTLVENGDVEELVVYEPTMDYGDGPGAEPDRRQGMTIPQLQARRLEVRKQVLGWIMADPGLASVREAWKAFCEAKDAEHHPRMLRITGNHDHDLRRPEFRDIYHGNGIELPEVADLLRLTRPGDPAWLILHGHQLDLASNHRVAVRQGEVISECVGLFYQGADRQWPLGDTSGWRSGAKTFRNELVVDDVGPSAFNANALTEVLFELVFQHNVAWEYFRLEDHVDAVAHELLTGARFFKFRHLDEVRLWNWMKTFQPARRPRVILGHTHEVRHSARVHGGHVAEGYYNSGSAGRFVGLLWGLEVVNGVATVVSWDQDAAGNPRRRAWSPDQEGKGSHHHWVLRG